MLKVYVLKIYIMFKKRYIQIISKIIRSLYSIHRSIYIYIYKKIDLTDHAFLLIEKVLFHDSLLLFVKAYE